MAGAAERGVAPCDAGRGVLEDAEVPEQRGGAVGHQGAGGGAVERVHKHLAVVGDDQHDKPVCDGGGDAASDLLGEDVPHGLAEGVDVDAAAGDGGEKGGVVVDPGGGTNSGGGGPAVTA